MIKTPLDHRIEEIERELLGQNADTFVGKNRETGAEFELLVQNFDDGYQYCATVGLNHIDIKAKCHAPDDPQKIIQTRTELIGFCRNDPRLPNEYYEMMADMAMRIADGERLRVDTVYREQVKLFIEDSDMKHIMFIVPEFVELSQYTIYDAENEIHSTWLMPLPISEKEYQYKLSNGADALIDLLEDKDVDVGDMYRKSVL